MDIYDTLIWFVPNNMETIVIYVTWVWWIRHNINGHANAEICHRLVLCIMISRKIKCHFPLNVMNVVIFRSSGANTSLISDTNNCRYSCDNCLYANRARRIQNPSPLVMGVGMWVGVGWGCGWGWVWVCGCWVSNEMAWNKSVAKFGTRSVYTL